MFQEDINAPLRAFHTGINKSLSTYDVSDGNSCSAQLFIPKKKKKKRNPSGWPYWQLALQRNTSFDVNHSSILQLYYRRVISASYSSLFKILLHPITQRAQISMLFNSIQQQNQMFYHHVFRNCYLEYAMYFSPSRCCWCHVSGKG